MIDKDFLTIDIWIEKHKRTKHKYVLKLTDIHS